MKAMPYTPIGPVDHTIPNGMWCPDVYQCPACLEQIQRAQKPKRLTDEMCAAEYWRAFTIFNAVASGGIAGDPIAANHQLDVWHRFATTSHAFEGGY